MKTGENLKITFTSGKGSGMFSKKDAFEINAKFTGGHVLY